MNHMSTGVRLVNIANQIAANFVAEEEVAALATADHIATFWDPRMNRRIFARADVSDYGLGVIAERAITLLRTRGSPPSQSISTEFSRDIRVDNSDAGRGQIL